MWRYFRQISPSPTWSLTCIYLPLSVNLYSRDTSWRYLTMMTLQDHPPSSRPHHRPDQKTRNNAKCRFKSSFPWTRTDCPRKKLVIPRINSSTWSPQPGSPGTTQETFLGLAVYYLIPDGTLSQAMETWPRHIDRFEWQFDKAFTGRRLFGEEILDQTRKRLQVFLHRCNTISLEDINTSALLGFGEPQLRSKRGEWVIPQPPRLGRNANAKIRHEEEVI